MSNVNPVSRHPSESPVNRMHFPPAPASASQVHANDLKSLLESGPNQARRAKMPDTLKPSPANRSLIEQQIDDLGAQLNHKTIERMLRAPDAEDSQACLNKLDTLLTKDNIKALLKGPNASANAETFARIEAQLNKGSIAAMVNPIETENVDTYRKHVDSEMFNLKASLMKASPESRFAMVRAFSRKEDPTLTNIQNYVNGLKIKSEHLCDVATQVKEAIGSLQYPHDDHWVTNERYDPTVKPHVRTYSFTHMAESTQDNPSEIRNFSTDQDKLDLTGIGKQLNKPLLFVNQLSGSSGEIQLHHSHAKNTTVVAISGNPGQPPFVLKVFGHVKEKDMVI